MKFFHFLIPWVDNDVLVKISWTRVFQKLKKFPCLENPLILPKMSCLPYLESQKNIFTLIFRRTSYLIFSDVHIDRHFRALDN
jgi:hypothetical protein